MKIGLIYPNRYAEKNLIMSPLLRLPPLNLLTLAGLTPEEYDIEIIDERYERLDFSRDFDLVGITALTSNAPRAYKIANSFRSKGTKVVIGGIHATVMPEEAAENADAVVVGEAESTWLRVLNDFRRDNLKKIYRGEKVDLEKTPVPQWDILPKKYNYLGFIQTTRGCPNNCNFCTVPQVYGRKVRSKPIGQVLKEIKRIGKRSVIFVDDNILALKDYATELFKALRKLNITWGGEASLNMMRDKKLLHLARESGCRGFYIGFESIKENILRTINKGFNKVKDYEKVVKSLHRMGMGVFGGFMFGSDGESPSIFSETFDFIRKIKIDGATFSILTPLPGTRLFKNLKEEGRIKTFNWEKFDMMHSVFEPLNMSPDQLQAGVKWIHRKFYSLLNTIRRSLHTYRFSPILSYINFGFMRFGQKGLTPD